MNEVSQTITVRTMPPELLSRSENMLAVAKSYAITCPELREAASEDLKKVKALTKEVEAQEAEITKPLMQAHRGVKELFRKPLEFLATAEATIKRACLAWDSEQDRIRRAEEAEASRKADEERKRLAAAAEKEKAAGNIETAHAIEEAAQFVAPVPVAREQPKIVGESHREVWRAEVTDIVALALAVGEGRASPELLQPNMPALNAQARSLKATLSIPGVRAVPERVLASRAA